MKKLVLALTLFAATNTFAQCTLLTTAVVSGDTLHCTGGDFYRTAVAYHPGFNLYYSNNAGGTTPDETFDANGQRLSGSISIDWRGLWYNSNLSTIEGNTWNYGFAIDSLQVNGHLGGNNSGPFSSQAPHAQAPGVYDAGNNRIYYYFSGVLSGQDRATGTAIATTTLTGNYKANNVLPTPLIFTGCSGIEIGLYDIVRNKIMLFNRATGALADSVAMPGTTTNTYADGQFAFANNIVWMFNLSLNKWIGYDIFAGTNSVTEESSIKLSVYPNPSQGIFALSGLDIDARIEIQNSIGQIMYTTQPGTYQTQVDLRSQTPGLYFLRVTQNGQQIEQKLIVH